MRTYRLAHITDLANLSEEDVLQFAKELPTIAATLRLMKSDAGGQPLRDKLPHLTFAPDIGDKVVVPVDGGYQSVPGDVMVKAERLNANAGEVADSAITHARRPRPR